MIEWRLVWRSTPCRASISTIARSAVEAPVAMVLLVDILAQLEDAELGIVGDQHRLCPEFQRPLDQCAADRSGASRHQDALAADEGTNAFYIGRHRRAAQDRFHLDFVENELSFLPQLRKPRELGNGYAAMMMARRIFGRLPDTACK